MALQPPPVPKQHQLPIVMVLLGFTQASLSSLYFMASSDERLQFTIKYVRATQNAMTFFAYGTMATHALGKTGSGGVLARALKPYTYGALAYLTVLWLVILGNSEVSCDDTAFLVESVSGMLLALSFGVVGVVVYRAMGAGHGSRSGGIQAPTRGHFTMGDATDEHTTFEDLAEVAQQRWQLVMLLAVNSGSAIFQLISDVVIRGAKAEYGSCALHGVEDGGLQFGVILLRILSYVVPVWGLLYVFFWLPRRVFEATSARSLERASYALMGIDAELEGADNLAL